MQARPAFQGRIKIGFAANGRVTAVDFFVVQQNGPYSGGGDYGAAAGAIGIIKALLSLRHGRHVGMPSWRTLNPMIDLDGGATRGL